MNECTRLSGLSALPALAEYSRVDRGKCSGARRPSVLRLEGLNRLMPKPGVPCVVLTSNTSRTIECRRSPQSARVLRLAASRFGWVGAENTSPSRATQYPGQLHPL